MDAHRFLLTVLVTVFTQYNEYKDLARATTAPTTPAPTTLAPTTPTPTPTTPAPTTPAADNSGCIFNVTADILADAGATPSPTGPPDTIYYKCLKNGSIDIDIGSFSSSGFVVRGIEPANLVTPDHCKHWSCKLSSDKHQLHISGCLAGTLHLLALDKLHSETSVVGGCDFKRFGLKCSNFDTEMQIAMAPTAIVPTWSTGTVTYDIPTVTMIITHPNNRTNLGYAVIGSKLNMYITVTDIQFYVKPIECYAKSGHANETVMLWNETVKSNDESLFKNIWTTTTNKGAGKYVNASTEVKGTFYAFRFVSTDEVHFTCKVRLCYQDDVIGSAECVTSYTPPQAPAAAPNPNTHVRKRKSVMTMKTKIKTVSSDLRIYDTAYYNRSIGHSVPSTVLVVCSVCFALLAVFRS